MTMLEWAVVWVLMGVPSPPDASPAPRGATPAARAAAARDTQETNAYLNALHARVHDKWAHNFLGLAADKLPSDNPLNNPALVAEFDITLRTDGMISEVVLRHGSGFIGFDAAARDVLRDSGPFPRPPAAAISDDDLVHLRWRMARDARACEGLQLHRLLEPAEQALPRLLHLGRVDEAVRRAAVLASEDGLESAITILATSWLREAIWSPLASVRAAAHLDARGVREGREWLARALTRPETATEAAAVLSARHRPICVMAKLALEGHDEGQRLAATNALRDSRDPLCIPGLMALLADPHVNASTRAAAATALGNFPRRKVVWALEAAARDKNPRVRAAARVAALRAREPGKYDVLLRLLRDHNPDVRAHVAVSLARSRLANVISELAVLASDSDAAPGVAAAKALARAADPEAVRVLQRLLTAAQPEVRLAAAHALVSRHDRGPLEALRPLIGQRAWPELQGLALVAASAPQIAEVATAPAWGFAAYRAWLAQGDRERAGRWLLDHLQSLPAPLQVDAMCEWLSWPVETAAVQGSAAQPGH